MKGDIVYILVIDSVVDLIHEHSIEGVFADEKEAQKAFKGIIEGKDIKELMKDWDYELEGEMQSEDWETKSDSDFEIWQPGWYDENHVAVFIKKCVVQ